MFTLALFAILAVAIIYVMARPSRADFHDLTGSADIKNRSVVDRGGNDLLLPPKPVKPLTEGPPRKRPKPAKR